MPTVCPNLNWLMEKGSEMVEWLTILENCDNNE